jgi:hypothetical protein
MNELTGILIVPLLLFTQAVMTPVAANATDRVIDPRNATTPTRTVRPSTGTAKASEHQQPSPTRTCGADAQLTKQAIIPCSNSVSAARRGRRSGDAATRGGRKAGRHEYRSLAHQCSPRGSTRDRVVRHVVVARSTPEPLGPCCRRTPQAPRAAVVLSQTSPTHDATKAAGSAALLPQLIHEAPAHTERRSCCEPGGIRTHDQGIKSPLLYR